MGSVTLFIRGIMKNLILKIVIAAILSFISVGSFAATIESTIEQNIMDELNPLDPNIDQILEQMDKNYIEQTGKSPFALPSFLEAADCQKFDCPLYVQIHKSEQKMYVYINGSLVHTWLVSTGVKNSKTPNFEGKPNGRIYDKYSSKASPGGDYKGLGNMPYAVFIYNGYAIHGTTVGNFSKLGTPASHGCVRLHADNGFIFNRLVRSQGVFNTWVSIID